MNETEHLLVCVSEECSEIIKSVDKALRFGLNDHYPDKPRPTNKESIEQEVADLLGVLEMLIERKVLDENVMKSPELHQRKKERVLKFMEYARQKHTLQTTVSNDILNMAP